LIAWGQAPDDTTPQLEFKAPENHYIHLHTPMGGKTPVKPMPELRSRLVTAEDPINLDIYYSLRSPYSYLALDRLLYLNSNYNVDMNIRIIFPVAARAPKRFGMNWYFFEHVFYDANRVAKYQDIPYRWPMPDPIKQDFENWPNATQKIAPFEEQPYIENLVLLGAAAQLQGKTPAFYNEVGHIIWDGTNDNWVPLLKGAVHAAGMDYDATMKDIKENKEKYNAVWVKNAKDQAMTGHGGVPNMTIREVHEPFFGQDRFDYFFYRLLQNGLTKRDKPIEPIVEKPLRWPDFLEK
jgi:2-hydroxychromene-2-carboxylate isomerase